MGNAAGSLALFVERVHDNHDTSGFGSAVVADLNALTQFVKDLTLDYFNTNVPSDTPGLQGVSIFVTSLGVVVNYSLTYGANTQDGQTTVEASYTSAAQVGISTLITLAFKAEMGPAGAVVGDYLGKLAGQVALDIQRDPNGWDGWSDRFAKGAQYLAKDIWGDLLTGDLKPSLAWLFDPAQCQALNDILFPPGGNDRAVGGYFGKAEAVPSASPIVLDLDGGGIQTTAVNPYGAHFDLDANGFAEAVGWVAPGEGILVRDLDNDGVVDDGRELFGDHTLLLNGQVAANGFQALAELDTNADGKVDANDAAFASLRVWPFPTARC